MSPLSCLPAYFVFGKQELDSLACAQRIAQYAADKTVEAQHKFLLVFLDQNLLHAVEQVQQHVYHIQQVGTNTAFGANSGCAMMLCCASEGS